MSEDLLNVSSGHIQSSRHQRNSLSDTKSEIQLMDDYSSDHRPQGVIDAEGLGITNMDEISQS